MFHLVTRELIESLKSIRSILIILFLTTIAYQSVTIIQKNEAFLQDLFTQVGEVDTSIYTAVIILIFIVFGFLFVFATSHHVINREIEDKTIRLLVTKVSRTEIVLGKFLGAYIFWLLIITITYLIIYFIVPHNFLLEYMQTLIYFFYIVAFVTFISTIVTKPLLTMFLGVFLGMTIPIIGLTAAVSSKWYLMMWNYLLPYGYLDATIWLFIPFAIGILFIVLAIIVMQRRDF